MNKDFWLIVFMCSVVLYMIGDLGTTWQLDYQIHQLEISQHE